MKYAVLALFVAVALLAGVVAGQALHIRKIEKSVAVMLDQSVLSAKMANKVDEYNAHVREHNLKMMK